MTISHDNIGLRYEEMFRTYFPSLCFFAGKYISDHDTCKEIVHKVFVAIWENKADFDFEKPAKSYLFTAVYNRCMNHIRDQKRTLSHQPIEEAMGVPDSKNYAGQLEAAELENTIWKVIGQLPEKCREIFVLNRFEGKKYQEIADQLNISVKTVETQMSKALKVLRENLKDYLHLFLLFLIKNFFG